ncbi:MAG: FG-GAP repeat domain-containing protein [Salinibacter sp.]
MQDDTLMNPLDFLYLYNGGGVAVGDLNGDQRPDLYFAGNQVRNRLYLNQGDFRFRNVTKAAQVGAAEAWSTGVSVVDVNQDGRLDVYVSVGGPKAAGQSRANKLFVNQGLGADSIPSFEEKARAYGIANTGYTTHAAFFDYNRDGDLDLYVLNNAIRSALTARRKAPITSTGTTGTAPLRTCRRRRAFRSRDTGSG